jgi:hypothetical protein
VTARLPSRALKAYYDGAAAVVDLLNVRLDRFGRVSRADGDRYSGSVAVSSTPQEFHRVIEDTASAAAPILSELGWIERARRD